MAFAVFEPDLIDDARRARGDQTRLVRVRGSGTASSLPTVLGDGEEAEVVPVGPLFIAGPHARPDSPTTGKLRSLKP